MFQGFVSAIEYCTYGPSAAGLESRTPYQSAAYDGGALGDVETESIAVGDTEGDTESVNATVSDGAADGDDMFRKKVSDVLTSCHPVRVDHSTSPVPHRTRDTVMLLHRCQQHDVRGHTVICVTGSVPATWKRTHAFVSAAELLYMLERMPSVAAVHG